MEWTWRIEDGAHVLGIRPLPPGVGELGFRGRTLRPGVPDVWGGRPQVRPRQVHGTRVEWVRGAGSPGECDAVRTAQAGLLLTVRTADCLPVLLASPTEGVALVHAGWRGLAHGVLEAAVATFGEPETLRAVLGPAIGVCCFEVGEEVAARFPAAAVRARRFPRPHVDLFAEAARRLCGAGVPPANLSSPGPCTRCHQHLLHSHRGSGGAPGRIVAFASASGPVHES